MLHLDGSYGEGGGQILRSALSLAVLSGVPVRIERIRAGRPRPGLRAQHLTAVRALAALSRAEVSGAELSSQELTFRPRAIQGGKYIFDVAEKTGSAGSVTLLAQALLPPLLQAPQPSEITLKGGTHVAWSPPAHYLMEVFLPALATLGAPVQMELKRWGWYPRGGGEVQLKITPAPALTGVEWLTPPPLSAFKAVSAASKLPAHVAQRQAARLKERLGESLPVTIIQAGGQDPGSMVLLWGPHAGFDALGARGKPAELVADEAAEAYLSFASCGAGVDRHLADMLALYLAQAPGPSAIATPEITGHLLTNLWVIEQFLGPLFQVEGRLGEPGVVHCRGEM
jgi:RNA 3'-terminal phosphate cyclase (ATP)